MRINVYASVPRCKVVSYHIDLFWGKASENGKAERAKRDLYCYFILNLMLFTSLCSFAEIECLRLNLVGKFHIVPYSWLERAVCHFLSCIYIILHKTPLSSPSYGVQSNTMKIFPFWIAVSSFSWQLRGSVLSITLDTVIVIVPAHMP